MHSANVNKGPYLFPFLNWFVFQDLMQPSQDNEKDLAR